MSHHLFAHLAHVEVLTPDPEASVRFYRDVLGLEESEREGQSIYLRGWGEWSHHSLKLTEAAQPGMAHIGWRAWSAEHLETAVARLEDKGATGAWQDAETGHGPSYRFHGPGGHAHEVFWETQRYEPPADMRSPYPNRPQRYVPRGIAPRQIDHVTVMTADPVGDAEWYRDVLGFTFTEYTVLDNADVAVFAMVTNNEKSHDLGLILDESGMGGRLHHVAWWVDTRDEVLRAADILLNADVAIEYGPGRHGMGEQDYLYVREPGGTRVEVNTGGYRLYEPDWETRKWTPAQGSNTFYKNVPAPQSMMEGFPPAEAKAHVHEDTANPWAAESVH
ncbi:MAG: catechol 2,3-dioxygenase [Solirubrobacteraceae bacterium]|jgi:catechol 2,3-dioxygenase|nr:catechol 2,3-dioxygenase [Solirubrobacteraceae bacterium]